MKILLYLSEYMIPIIVFYIVGYAIVTRHKVYEDFIDGAKSGLKTVVSILPTLIGLMIGVRVISSSGLLEAIAGLIGNVTRYLNIPSSVIPVIIVRIFSTSAANGICLEIFEKFGTDSYEGFMVSILMSCTETVFYTMSVYYMAAKVNKTRWTLAGAFIATIAGIAASVVMATIYK